MLRNLIRGVSSRPQSFRFFSSTATASLKDFYNSDAFEMGKKVLARLDEKKSLKIDIVDLRTMVANLSDSNSSSLQLASKILEKVIFKVREFDKSGHVSSYHLIQLIEGDDLPKAVDYLKLLVKVPREMENNFCEFDIGLTLRALIEKKEDDLAFDLLKSFKETTFPEKIEAVIDREYKDELIMNLFLPRLNWAAIEYLVSESVQDGQITVSAGVLHEIFHVLLAPNPNDPYYDPVDAQPFTSDVLNPRFHSLLELLQSWKNSGIPIKGQQISKAMEETFKRFLPTDSMMDELQKLL